MKIVDKRKNRASVKLKEICTGDWFIYKDFVYRKSFVAEGCNVMRYSDDVLAGKLGTEERVTPIEVELHIVDPSE